MKEYLTTILLCTAIVLISLGIHTNNFIFASIGGVFAGVYNTMVYYKKIKVEINILKL